MVLINPREEPSGLERIENPSSFLTVVRRAIRRREQKGEPPPTVQVIVQVRGQPDSLASMQQKMAAGFRELDRAGIEDDREGMAMLSETVEQGTPNRWHDVETFWRGPATRTMENIQRPTRAYLAQVARREGAHEAKTAIRMKT